MCRTAKAALSQAGIQFSDRDFFKERFTEEDLRSLLGGESPKTVFNFKSVAFKKGGLLEADLQDTQLFELLIENPRYFKRPLVVLDGKLLVGTNAKKLGEEIGF